MTTDQNRLLNEALARYGQWLEQENTHEPNTTHKFDGDGRVQETTLDALPLPSGSDIEPVGRQGTGRTHDRRTVLGYEVDTRLPSA